LCRCNCPSIELDIGAGRSACRPKLYAKHHCVLPSSVVQGKDQRRSLKTSMIVEEWSSAPRLWEMIRALTASLAFFTIESNLIVRLDPKKPTATPPLSHLEYFGRGGID
jgi:hypothetical protein